MKKQLCQWLTGLFLAGILAGCASQQTAVTVTQPDEVLRRQLRSETVAMGERLIAAMQTADYQAFIADMTPQLRAKFTEKMFYDQMREFHNGNWHIVRSEYLRELRQPPFVKHLWLLELRGQDAESGSNDQEHIFAVTLAFIGDRYHISAFGML